ncbi:hypothetical protein NQ318_004730 [Aromia moschata]|uniref:Mos1 transposase HTH domain-containing protein n=1 Tax=Aromia moschata TaxID=1265417 RepID=A0AAV8Y0T8_9CUCU|nr:hypothetical protein NQ318_004730 [Aromia moschata]
MSDSAVHSAVAQRIVIRFLTNEGVKPAEIWNRLRAQFEERTLSWARVKAWCAEFKKGRKQVENLSHAGRPRTSITPESITAVRDLIDDLCNPYWMREVHTQRPEKINVWAGIPIWFKIVTFSSAAINRKAKTPKTQNLRWFGKK